MASLFLVVAAHRSNGLVVGRFLRRCVTTELDRLRRCCDRLTQLQRRIRFPPLETITVNGEDIRLPLPSVEAVLSPSHGELEYLVGFFDGDGCVTMNSKTGAVHLSISQNVDSVDVLLHFRTMLGGGVYHHYPRAGSRKASVRWQVHSSKMSQAAVALSSLPSMKQAQLEIAMRGTVALSDRDSVEQKLKTFKQKHHAPSQMPRCSWRYLAGFFDAEGCISVRSYSGLSLRLKQVNPRVLMELQGFLRHYGWRLYHYGSCSELICNNTTGCKEVLERLLENGLLVKRKQAKLALTLSTENHLEIRDAIFALNGWQKRYQRLDREGIARATEIHILQNRLRSRVGLEFTSLKCQIDELRSEHDLQTLISRSTLLRNDMRQALREGGHLTPFSSS